MKESRSINGAQRPLHRQSLRSLPAHPRVRSSWAPSSPGGLGCGDTPLAALLSEGCMGTLLSLLCFRRGVPIIIPIIILGQRGSDCMPTSRDRFSKAGKTILDPSMRTVHSPPGLAADRPGNCRGLSAPPPGTARRASPFKPRFARGAALSLSVGRPGDENAASQIRTEAMYEGLSTG